MKGGGPTSSSLRARGGGGSGVSGSGASRAAEPEREAYPEECQRPPDREHSTDTLPLEKKRRWRLRNKLNPPARNESRFSPRARGVRFRRQVRPQLSDCIAFQGLFFCVLQ